MKRFAYTVIALALAATACQQPDGIEESVGGTHQTTLTASLNAETRTMLGDQYSNLWSAEDCIAVFIDGSSEAAIFELTEGAGSTTASFAGYGRGSNYVALYPASAAVGFDGSSVEIELPAEQQYAESSFGPDSFPMVASSSSTELKFRNLCAVLKLSMRGEAAIQSIRFTANDEQTPVAGAATVDISDPQTPQLTMSDGGSNEVVLVCGNVTLDSATPTDFYIVLPAQNYEGGFTVTVCTASGDMQKRASQDIELQRSSVFSMPVFDFSVNVEIGQSEALEGEGTAASPFLIRSIGDLLLFRNAVNTANGKIKSADTGAEVAAQTAHYLQTADIDLAGYNNSNDTWTPIGDYSTDNSLQFKGTFDGGEHSITNLITDPEKGHQGLFGYCSAATISNLSVSGKVSGKDYVGIVAGYLSGKITNCEVSGSVTGTSSNIGGIVGYADMRTSITDCTNRSAINGYATVGGIAGWAYTYSIINNCVNLGAVSNLSVGGFVSGPVGGIVGYGVYSSIMNCSNHGNVKGWSNVGGIAGMMYFYNETTVITNCYNTGDISATGPIFGGIAGTVSGDNDANKAGRLENCISTGKLSSATGGAIAGTNSAVIKNCYWLDSSGATKGVANGNGTVESVVALTEQLMYGDAATGAALYTDAQGTYYTSLLDALNAWAADKTAPSGFYFGWQKGNPYPEFTFAKAVRPNGSTESLYHSFVVRHTNTTYAAPLVTGPYTSTTINWGDGQSEEYDKSLTHTYTSGGEHAVEISGSSIVSFELANIKGVTKLELK